MKAGVSRARTVRENCRLFIEGRFRPLVIVDIITRPKVQRYSPEHT